MSGQLGGGAVCADTAQYRNNGNQYGQGANANQKPAAEFVAICEKITCEMFSTLQTLSSNVGVSFDVGPSSAKPSGGGVLARLSELETALSVINQQIVKVTAAVG